MNKFYVYVEKTKDPNREDLPRYYVDETLIEQFALDEFNPMYMEYSGCMIEAPNASAAHEVYNTFGSEGNIIWADEPMHTRKKREIFEGKAKLLKSKMGGLLDALNMLSQRANKAAMQTLATSITLDLIKVNEKMSQLARFAHELSKDTPELSSENIYTKIKKKYVEKLNREYGYDESGPHS